MSYENNLRTEADSVAELAARGECNDIDIRTIPGSSVPFYINPHTGTAVSLESLLDKPVAIAETRSFHDFASFVAYVTRFKKEGAIMVEGQGDIRAILDYHAGPEQPDRGSHVASLRLSPTAALVAWRDYNRKPLDQLTFVEFLEERAKEITEPDAASVLEIAQELHVVNGSTVTSCVRSGANMHVEFTKDETVRGGKGSVEIPRQLLVSIQPFDDHPHRFDALARLRIRTRGGQVSFTYEFDDLERALREAFRDIATKAAKAAGVPLFL